MQWLVWSFDGCSWFCLGFDLSVGNFLLVISGTVALLRDVRKPIISSQNLTLLSLETLGYKTTSMPATALLCSLSAHITFKTTQDFRTADEI